MTDDILGAIEATITRFRAGKIENSTALCAIRSIMRADEAWGKAEAAAAHAKRQLADTIERVRG